MNIMNLFDTEGFIAGLQQEKYKSHYKPMSEKFGANNLGFYTKIIGPKKFSCPYHWHSGEEELVIVIEGEATVRNNGEFRIIKPGDLIYYGTGPDSVHHMYNHTDKPFKYFVLSNQVPTETCHYPDSKKQSEPEGFSQNGVMVDYFKDEEDPSIYWPKDRL
ncbi:MAG: cupin domain-containing protein [Pseudobdellovibrionaceae bacterium]